jgi:hypothetical protein
MTDTSISSLSPSRSNIPTPGGLDPGGLPSCAALQDKRIRNGIRWRLRLVKGPALAGPRKSGRGARRGASEQRYQAMPGDVRRLKRLAGPHPATLRNNKDLYGMQKVRGSNPLSSTLRFGSSEACFDLKSDLRLPASRKSSRLSGLVPARKLRRSGPFSKSRTLSLPVRAVSWEPNREPADDLRGSTQVVLGASELPSAPASAFTRSDSRSGQPGRRQTDGWCQGQRPGRAGRAWRGRTHSGPGRVTKCLDELCPGGHAEFRMWRHPEYRRRW